MMYVKYIWRRKWQLTPFLPGKSHGQRSLAATVCGFAESDATEHTRIRCIKWFLVCVFSLLLFSELVYVNLQDT